MKKILTILAAVALFCAGASAQTAEQFKASYERQVKYAGAAGVGVEGILNRWAAAFPEDTTMLESRFSYYLTKARKTVAVTKPDPKYLGQDPLITLKDSTGTPVRYFEVPQYDDSLFALACKSIERAIELAPCCIDYRFDRITALLDYELESPDMACAALLELIEVNFAQKPRWTNYDGVLSQEDFRQAMQEYCFSFYSLGTPGGYDAFLAVSERMLRENPKDVSFIDNVGAYWQVAKKDPKKAAKFYKKALKLDPDDYAAKTNMKIIENQNKKK